MAKHSLINRLRYAKGFILLFILTSFITVESPTDQQVKEYALKLAGKYNLPAGTEILSNTKASVVARYMEHKTSNVELETFATTIHECLHAYDTKLGLEQGYDQETKQWHKAYFIDTGITIQLPAFEVIKTATLDNGYYPKEVKKFDRYSTYITGFVSSNKDGIFGLLEEFNAYRHDCYTLYKMMEAGELLSIRGKSDEYIQSNQMSAYWEFNIFMAYYLKYTKEKEPAMYHQIMQSKELRLAYTLMETNWRDVLTKVYANKKLAKNFVSFKEEDQYYTPELQKIMNDFMIPEDQLGAHVTYVKAMTYDPKIIAANRKTKQEVNTKFEFSGKDIQFLQFRDQSYYYVIAKEYVDFQEAQRDPEEDYKPRFPDAGLFIGDKKVFFLYLYKFKDKSEADKMAESLKNQFPKVRVM